MFKFSDYDNLPVFHTERERMAFFYYASKLASFPQRPDIRNYIFDLAAADPDITTADYFWLIEHFFFLISRRQPLGGNYCGCCRL